MDAREQIRKLRDGYVDWFGQPSTKEAYDAQQSTEAQIELNKKAIEQLDAYKVPTTSAEPPLVPALSDEYLTVKIDETTLPHQDKLRAAGFVELGDLPITKKALCNTKGIGPRAADQIATWYYVNWGAMIA